jgi:multisubunit Na+/H+ antiporter MnhE subunit
MTKSRFTATRRGLILLTAASVVIEFFLIRYFFGPAVTAPTFIRWYVSAACLFGLFVGLYIASVVLRLLWVASLRRQAHPLRWLGFLLFVVGFHFDLLAS